MHFIAATDYSSKASNACRFAVQAAKKLNAKISFVHIFKFPTINTNVGSDYTKIREYFQSGELIRLKEYVTNIITSVGMNPDEINSEAMVFEGSVSGEMINICNHLNPDIIFTGTHDTSGFKNLMREDHTWELIHHARIPVFIIPQQSEFKDLKKYVYAMEGRQEESEIFNFLMPFIQINNGQISVLHIRKNSNNEGSEIKNMEKDLRNMAGQNNFYNYELIIRDKESVIHDINEFIKEQNPDCLVLSNNQSVRIENILPSLFRKAKKISLQTKLPLLIIPSGLTYEKSKSFELPAQKKYAS